MLIHTKVPQLHNCNNSLLAYADDIDVLAETLDEVKEPSSQVIKISTKAGLQRHDQKTKVMETSPGPTLTDVISTGQRNIEVHRPIQMSWYCPGIRIMTLMKNCVLN